MGGQGLGEESTVSTMSHVSLTLIFCSQLITSYLVAEAQDRDSHSCGVEVFCLPLPGSRWLWEHRLPRCQAGLEGLGLAAAQPPPRPNPPPASPGGHFSVPQPLLPLWCRHYGIQILGRGP